MATDTTLSPSKKSRSRRTPPPPAPAPTRSDVVAPVRTKRSWGYGFAAIAAIIVGGLITMFAYTSLQHTDEVFVVNTNVDRGATITSKELSVIQVAPNQHVAGFTQASAIVGKVATVDLPSGSLVTPSSISTALPIPAGKSLVGIALKKSQLPSVPLHPGDKVTIVPIAQQQGTVTANADVPSGVQATVATTDQVDPSSGLVVVNVYVSQSAAGDVAGRAAAGQVTIYVSPAQ